MSSEQRNKKKVISKSKDKDNTIDFAAIMKQQVESIGKEPKPLNTNIKVDNKIKKHSKQPEEELKSSRFRWLNEKLYTSNSTDSFEYFKQNKDCFKDYHEGFKNQVQKWPKNPVDIFIKELLKEKYHTKTIADLGCGEGKLELQLKEQNPERVIYSFDIGKMNDHVIQADISNLPLEDQSLDIAIFSLSLMSTNFVDMIIEANRTLKMDGLLFIAEVSSRLEINKFVSLLKTLGFIQQKVSQIETYFYVMIFKKTSDISKKKIKKILKEINPQEYLKPCKYKKR